MAAVKQYTIDQLFKTKWSQLSVGEQASVLEHKFRWQHAKEQGLEQAAGHCAIMILRALRVNKSAVSKINVEQAVDCINDLAFINEPFFQFPGLPSGVGPNSTDFQVPQSHLKNHTLGQLYWIDSLFSKVIMAEYSDSRAHPPQTPSTIAEIFLHEMIGVIYTHPDLFDEKQVSERGMSIGKILTEAHRHVVIHTYANIKEFIVNAFPFTFPQIEEQESDEPRASKAPVDSEPMWQTILFDLSESKAYQGMDKTKSAPMYEALTYLEKKHKDAIEFKQKQRA